MLINNKNVDIKIDSPAKLWYYYVPAKKALHQVLERQWNRIVRKKAAQNVLTAEKTIKSTKIWCERLKPSHLCVRIFCCVRFFIRLFICLESWSSLLLLSSSHCAHPNSFVYTFFVCATVVSFFHYLFFTRSSRSWCTMHNFFSRCFSLSLSFLLRAATTLI